MTRITHWIDKMLAGLLVFLMAVMVVVVSWQVFTRYVLASPSTWTSELATFLLIWISLLGAAYALRMKAHLGVELLERSLRGSSRIMHAYVVYLSVILFAFFVFVYGGTRLVYITLQLEQASAVLQIPMGYVYLVLPLSGLLMIYYTVVALREGPSEPTERAEAYDID